MKRRYVNLAVAGDNAGPSREVLLRGRPSVAPLREISLREQPSLGQSQTSTETEGGPSRRPLPVQTERPSAFRNASSVGSTLSPRDTSVRQELRNLFRPTSTPVHPLQG